VRRAASDVVVGFTQADDGALQPDVHGVGQRGVVRLGVVVRYFIHPALEGRHRT